MGSPAAGMFPPSRDAERTSVFREVRACARGLSTDEGHERGRFGDRVPAPPRPGERTCAVPAAAAVALRELVAESLPLPRAEVAVSLAAATVTDTLPAVGGGIACSREIAFCRVLLGPDPDLPRWSRTFSARPSAWNPETPPPWIAPLRREVRSWTGRESRPPAPGTLAVLDAFAAADLARTVAVGWLAANLGAGQAVLPAGLEVDDPGFAFPPLAGSGDLDAEGSVCRPLRVVRAGCLLELPRTLGGQGGGTGAPTGSAVVTSWRGRPQAGWRSLTVRADARVPLPDGLPVVTRVLLLEGLPLVAGLLPGGARFGPVPLGTPAAWLGAALAGCGPAVPDGTGIPVSVPPLLVRVPRRTMAP